MKKTAITLTSFLLLFALGFLFFGPQSGDQLPVKSERDPEAVSGAMEALESWSLQRSYPFEELPSAGYVQAFEEREAIFASGREAETTSPWEALGPWNTAGRTLTLEINKLNPTTIWLGSASGGIWRTRTGGEGAEAWHRIATGFPVLGVSSIKLAPSDTSIVYAGTGEVYNIDGAGLDPWIRPFRGSYGIGILKSADGGATWTKSLDWSYDQERGVNDLAIHPTNPNIVYAATSNGVYKTIDGGMNWTQINSTPMAMSLALNTTDTDTLYAAFGNLNSTGKGIYRSYDAGATWTQCTSNLPTTFGGKIHLDLYENNPSIIYASIGNSTSQANGASWLCRSANHGQTWTVQSTSDYTLWQGWFSHDVAIHPNDPNELYAVGVECRISTNSGTSLFAAANNGLNLGTPPINGPDGGPNYIHSDIHEVEYHPTQPDTVYFGTDGGMFRRTGSTMKSLNGGLQTTQFYNGTNTGSVDTMIFMGGLQDNSTVIWTGSPAWQRVLGGDGSYSGLPFDGVPYRLASYQNLNIGRIDVSGNWVQVVSPPGSGISAFIAPYRIAPSDNNVMYAGRERVFYSNDGGQNWSPTGPSSFDGNFFTDLAVSLTNSDKAIGATGPYLGPHHIYTTDNGGASWTTANMSGLPDRYPVDVAFDPTNDNVVYVTYSGFGTGHVFRSEDLGQTWADITGTLPDIPTNAIAIDQDYPNVLYVGNDLGVYVSEDYGNTWNVFDTGLPEAVIAMDLVISKPNRKLRLATHGNGAYQRDLIVPSGIGITEESGTAINAFPNPFQHTLNISLREQGSYTVLNAQGQVVSEGESGREAPTQINTSHWASGHYYLRTNKGVIKLMKVK